SSVFCPGSADLLRYNFQGQIPRNLYKVLTSTQASVAFITLFQPRAPNSRLLYPFLGIHHRNNGLYYLRWRRIVYERFATHKATVINNSIKGAPMCQLWESFSHGLIPLFSYKIGYTFFLDRRDTFKIIITVTNTLKH